MVTRRELTIKFLCSYLRWLGLRRKLLCIVGYDSGRKKGNLERTATDWTGQVKGYKINNNAFM